MKRVIIALAIAIMVLPLAFATDPAKEVHSLVLRSAVGKVTPAFQFEFTSGMLGTSNPLVTNSGAEEFGAGNYDEYGTDGSAIDVADISQYGLNLLFTAKLANEAKCNASYTLTFKAGGFEVTRNDVAGTLDPVDAPYIEVAEDIDARLGLYITNLVQGESLQVRFNGTECATGDLATFKVVYPADSTLDPTSSESYYYANISLEISSDN